MPEYFWAGGAAETFAPSLLFRENSPYNKML